MRGVTFVDLLNFLGLAAILSTVGMYGLARYVRHAKTAEAIGSVTAMAGAAATSYDTSDAMQPAGTKPEAARAMRHFPPPSKTSVPADPLDVRAKRYQSSQTDWAVSPWRELRFSIPQPQYYAYSFESQGTGATAKATAIAHGDLDGDGTSSAFSVTIAPNEALDAKVAKSVERVDPEE